MMELNIIYLRLLLPIENQWELNAWIGPHNLLIPTRLRISGILWRWGSRNDDIELQPRKKWSVFYWRNGTKFHWSIYASSSLVWAKDGKKSLKIEVDLHITKSSYYRTFSYIYLVKWLRFDWDIYIFIGWIVEPRI